MATGVGGPTTVSETFFCWTEIEIGKSYTFHQLKFQLKFVKRDIIQLF